MGRCRRTFARNHSIKKTRSREEQMLKRHLPQLRFEVRPHIETISPAPAKKTQSHPIAKKARTIVIIGAVTAKWREAAYGMSTHRFKNEANLKFVLLGFTDRDDEFEDLPSRRFGPRLIPTHFPLR